MSDAQNSGQTNQSNSNQDFHRNVAFKFRIGELATGRPVFDQSTQRFNYLDLNGQNVVRINVIGNIVDKYESDGDSKFMVFTIDDGSGQIKMRVFADDVERFKNFAQGQTVVVIGLLRSYNDEVYITPEVMKDQDPRYLMVRKLEVEKQRNVDRAVAPVVVENPVAGSSQGEVVSGQESPVTSAPNSAVGSVKDKILEKIKAGEADGGIDTDKIILELKEATPEIINIEIKKLLEEGIIFEPRPGRLRWLG
jgi:RPA family protein